MKIDTGTIQARIDERARKARCILITEGLGNLRDKNYYTAEAIESAVRAFSGKQFFLDHPSSIDEESRPERSVRDLAGWFSDTKLGTVRDPNTGEHLSACYATLNFAESEPGTLAYDQMRTALRYQAQFPRSKDVFCGISINASGMSEPGEIEGVGRVNAVTAIEDVFSADIVTKPARGGKFLALSESFKTPTQPKRWRSQASIERERLVREGLLRPGVTQRRLVQGTATREAITSSARAVLLRTAERIRKFLDSTRTASAERPLGDVPVASVLDDLERKKGVRRSMGHQEAARTFAHVYEEGSGDGMRGADPNDRDLALDADATNDSRADKAQVNYRYAAAPERSCGHCAHFRPDDPANPEDGGGCSEVKGAIRFVDSCDLWRDRRPDAVGAFHESYRER